MLTPPFLPRLLAYTARLAEFLRTREDNPLARFNSPRRSSRRRWRFRALFLLSVFGMGCMAYSVLLEGVSRTYEYFFGLWVAAVPLLPIVCLWFFGHPFRSREHLEELVLTPLPRGEAAFGSVWGAVHAAWILFLPLWSIQILFEVLHAWTGMDFPWPIVRLLVPPVVFLYALALVIHVWLDHGTRLLPLLVRIAGFHMVTFFFLYVSVVIPLVILFNVLGIRKFADVIAAGYATVLCCGITLYWVYLAGQHAGHRFFAPIDPESLADAYWLANEKLARKEKPVRRAALRRLARRLWICDWKSNAVAFVCAIGLLCVVGLAFGWMVNADQRPWALHAIFGFSALLALGIYAGAALVLARTGGRDDIQAPLVAGSILDSTTRYASLVTVPLVLMGGAAAAMDFGAGAYQFRGELLLMGLAYAGIALLALYLSVLTILLLLPRGGRRRLAYLCVGGGILLQALPLVQARGHRTVFLYDVNDAGVMALCFGAFVVLWLTVPGLRWLGQRIHEREAQGLARHVLTTDPPPSAAPNPSGAKLGTPGEGQNDPS